MNGVLQAHHTVRWVNSSDLVHYASRMTGLEINNVYGGGGSIPPIDQKIYFDEIYSSGGYARPGEQPDHFMLTSQEGQMPTPGSTIHIVAQWQDANNQR